METCLNLANVVYRNSVKITGVKAKMTLCMCHIGMMGLYNGIAWLIESVVLLVGIAVAAQAIPPFPTRFSIAWSVCLSSVTFVHHS